MSKKVHQIMRVGSAARGTLAPTLAAALWKDALTQRPELVADAVAKSQDAAQEALDRAEAKRARRASKRRPK